MKINIQVAQVEDAEAIAHLLHQLGYPVSIAEAAERIKKYNQPSYTLWVAKKENITVGFIALHIYEVLHLPAPEGRILSFCTDEKVHGEGVGTFLLNEAENYFKENGCYKIVLNSNLRRTETHQYYTNRGYQFTSKHFIKMIEQ